MEIDPVLISIQFQIAILALAVPLLLQVIFNLDKKYNSDNIVSCFLKEPGTKIFILLLFLSIILLVCTLLVLMNNKTTFYNIKLMLLIINICLIISFFILVFRIAIYYQPNKLYNNLKWRTLFDDKPHYAIWDILLFAVDNNDRLLASQVTYYFTRYFNIYFNTESAKYTNILHHDLSNVIVVCNKISKDQIFDNTIISNKSRGGEWLLMITGKRQIDQSILKTIWQIAISNYKNNKANEFMHLWVQILQYYRIFLNPSSYTGKSEIRNEFKKYMWFILASSSYYNQQKFIKYVFEYDVSEGNTVCSILPVSFDEIFKEYIGIFAIDSCLFDKFIILKPAGSVLKYGEAITRRSYIELICIFLIYFFSGKTLINGKSPLETRTVPKDEETIDTYLRYLDKFSNHVSKFIITQSFSDIFDSEFYSLDGHRTYDQVTSDFFSRYKEELIGKLRKL